MGRDDTNPAICPECGAEVSLDDEICPDCETALRTARGDNERLKGQLRHDTVVDPGLLDDIESERSLQSQQRRSRERRPSSGPKRLEDADPDELRVVSAELIMPGSPAARAASRDARPPQREGPRSGGIRKVVLSADPSSNAETPAVDMVGPQRGQPISASTDQVPRDRPQSALGLIAAELEDALEAGFQSWLGFTFADQLSLIAALGMIVSALLPWTRTSMGMLTGGELTWLFAAATIAIMVVRQRRLRTAAREDDSDDDVTLHGATSTAVGRLNLMQILLGLAAVVYVLGVALGLYLADTLPGKFDVRYGLFVALGSAMGLAYSGIACFVRDARRLRQ